VSFFTQSGNRKDPSVRIIQYRGECIALSSMYKAIYSAWPSTTDGVAVPIIVYIPSRQNDSLIELPGQSLMWQGNKLCINKLLDC